MDRGLPPNFTILNNNEEREREGGGARKSEGGGGKGRLISQPSFLASVSSSPVTTVVDTVSAKISVTSMDRSPAMIMIAE
jgi:hypothetical protein